VGRVIFHCDGNDHVGAGHVARCVPLATAFEQLGWRVRFVGEYGGLASWLLQRAGIAVDPPDPDGPCGIAVAECDAAVVDSYLLAPESICQLAAEVPVVTLGEANRCPTRGIVIDYHLDRADATEDDLLAGPQFAPIDPAFAGAGRAGAEVRRMLVTLGGSLPARRLLAQLIPSASAVFPQAEIVIAGEAPQLPALATPPRLVTLPWPTALVDVVGSIDLAVTAAGLTAYELACAGIPEVAIAIVPNQRRVVDGLRTRSLAPCLDLTRGDSPAELAEILERLRDPAIRRQLAERGSGAFDGRGALRAASALAERFGAWSQLHGRGRADDGPVGAS
jgi:UDP-2,4-diacetamido-2,4,6-trideoxy-beta-L-altropyranose hydrolase